MNIFLRRHPSASPKIKNYINRFEKIANEFQDENHEFHKNTQQLDDQFKLLSHDLKRALVSRSSLPYKPPRERIFPNMPHHENVNTFMTDPLSKPSTSTAKKGTPPKIVQPKKCNPISNFLPTRPIYGAYKYYDSIASHEIKQEEKELMDEIRNYPQLEYEYRTFTEMKKVDPYFHIGGFPREVLLRSPDENVYNHIQSGGTSNSSYYDNNDYIDEYLDDYIENPIVESNEHLDDVHQENDNHKDSYLLNNPIDDENNIPIPNNRRAVSTR